MAKQWVNFRDIRSRLTFEAVLSYYGIMPGKGHDFKIICSFHDDTRPSLSINTKKNVFHCFSCGAKGNTLDFVTMMERGDPANTDDVREGALVALNILGDSPKPNSSAGKSKNRPPEKRAHKQKKKKRDKGSKHKKGSGKPVEAVTDTQAFGVDTTKVVSRLEAIRDEEDRVALIPLTFTLKLNPAHPYLKGREITSEQAERYDIGYCSRGMMKGRICFPLKNEEGELVGYAGRWASDDIPEDQPRYKLPQGFPKQEVLYNLDNFKRLLDTSIDDRIGVVVEGFWSAIKWTEAGIPTVACMGHSLSEEQAYILARTGVRKVMVIFDGDEAGQAGVPEALMNLSRVGLWGRFAPLLEDQKPDGIFIYDIDDFMESVCRIDGTKLHRKNA